MGCDAQPGLHHPGPRLCWPFRGSEEPVVSAGRRGGAPEDAALRGGVLLRAVTWVGGQK